MDLGLEEVEDRSEDGGPGDVFEDVGEEGGIKDSGEDGRITAIDEKMSSSRVERRWNR